MLHRRAITTMAARDITHNKTVPSEQRTFFQSACGLFSSSYNREKSEESLLLLLPYSTSLFRFFFGAQKTSCSECVTLSAKKHSSRPSTGLCCSTSKRQQSRKHSQRLNRSCPFNNSSSRARCYFMGHFYTASEGCFISLLDIYLLSTGESPVPLLSSSEGVERRISSIQGGRKSTKGKTGGPLPKRGVFPWGLGSAIVIMLREDCLLLLVVEEIFIIHDSGSL